MIEASKISELNKIAKQMVQAGKGILAADESEKTVGKRFASINLENNEDNRRAFREMLLTSRNEGQYISGVILHDETIRQSLADGRSFVSILQSEGILPGIKVDQGLADMEGPPSAEATGGVPSPTEKVTKGLEGLEDRLKEHASLGAKFCKWRAVITIDEANNLPTDANIRQNAKDLAAYALVCQEVGLVPMVEPEVLLDGSHSMEKCKEASEKVLAALFDELKNSGVALEGLILKTNMVLPGKDSGSKASPTEVAENTLMVFKKVLPGTLAGVAFLSGGQSEIQATENLNALNQQKDTPYPLTFSYARALQDGATKAWQGKRENLENAQAVFLHRAKMNSLASQGKYSKELEEGFISTEASASQN